MIEGTTLDKKSIRLLSFDPKGWKIREIAKHCVAFANARGGEIYFGIEDNAGMPAPDQRIPDDLCERLEKDVYHHTTNVAVTAKVHTFSNNGQALVLT